MYSFHNNCAASVSIRLRHSSYCLLCDNLNYLLKQIVRHKYSVLEKERLLDLAGFVELLTVFL